MTAISHRHALVRDATLSLEPSIQRWIKGLKHTKGMILCTWRLEFVLAALTKALFESIVTCHLKYLTWKTHFLLAITSRRQASEMHDFCFKPPYIRFSGLGVTVFTRLEFLAKVYTKANTSLCQQCATKQMAPYATPCVCRALNEYVRRSVDFRQDGTAQLFFTYGDESGQTHLQTKTGWSNV